MQKLTFLFVLLFAASLFAQEQTPVYVTKEMRAAYTKETRSLTGAPGKNYWQNHSVYNIKVEVDPKTGKLTAKETITYYNESPDSLKTLVLRLYQDINKSESSRDWPMNKKFLGSGTEIISAGLNGKALNVEVSDSNKEFVRAGTNMFIIPQQKIAPKSSVELTFEWSFNLKEVAPIRMGPYDSTSYLVGYWYPQMSVYDDIDGWDKNDYKGMHEFYNDFSEYNVEVKVPAGFTVWAAGDWTNPEEIYNEPYLSKYKKALTSDDVVNIITKDDLTKNVTKDNGGFNTYKFEAVETPDFTFALSDHYLWDGVSLIADKQTGRRVFVSAAYKEQSEDFYAVAGLAKESLEYFSYTLPGVPYPFPKMTVFNGAGGMEFPMVVNDGSYKDPAATVHVTSHEIAHSYMPFYMGTNERKYAWMDEGWANMLPMELQMELVPGYNAVAINAQSYASNAGTFDEVPPFLLNENVSGFSYRDAAYYRPATAYYLLRQTLGKEKFDKALRGYMHDWHGKHPTPNDFFLSMNKYAEENLNWFWKPWFFEVCYADLSVKLNDSKPEEKAVAVVTNEGGMPVPIKITVGLKDKSEKTYEKSAYVWKEGNKQVVIDLGVKTSDIVYVTLGAPEIPDVYHNDNNIMLDKTPTI